MIKNPPNPSTHAPLNRRELLLTTGALVVYGSGLILATDAAAQGAAAAAVPLGPSPSILDTWISIAPTGLVTVNSGKMDCGQGLGLAYAQIVAEELDVAVESVQVTLGDTRLSPNQGGGSASSGLRQGSNPLRNAAAEARRVLLNMAAVRLAQPENALAIENGMVFVKASPDTRVSYADLVGGKSFATTLKWNNQIGNGMNVQGIAKPKEVSEYRIVGKGHKRQDIADKVGAKLHYTAHIRPDNLLHGRVVRPDVAGAMPLKVDAASIASIKGAKPFVKGGFVAVVAETEWDAVRAARMLKVTWSDSAGQLTGGEEKVFDYIRAAKPTASNAVPMFSGKKAFDAKPTLDALAASKKVVEAEYECAFQSHARMSPSCGVADVRADSAQIWSDTQKPHYLREGIAKFLQLPADKVNVQWMNGAGSYGRSDADEAPYEAALLSKEFGRPVRVQWSRKEGMAWDPKAPAAVINMKAGLDDANNLTGWLFKAKGFNGWDVKFNAESPEHVLVGMLTGHKKWTAFNFNTPEESYEFPNHVHWWETVAPYMEQASPLRTAHMRAPQEMQTRFGQECFIDEVALAAGMDPAAFRLKHIKDPREAEVLKAATQKLGWEPRDANRTREANAKVMTGRGVALYAGYQSYAAVACEVDVNRETGQVWVKKVAIGFDCGLVVNPVGVRAALEGQIMQGISRSLYEEVHFNEKEVTSVDWQSYRIANMQDMPAQVDLVLLNRPDKPIGGAGEPAIVILPAAVANAVFDATGVRIRRYPLTPERVKKALA
jgi:nicotinate dehydrogenase subunit B